MRVQVINLAAPKVLNNGVESSQVLEHSLLRSSKLDSFEKQSSQISFTGKSDNDNLSDAMTAIGLVGGVTLLSIVTGIAMAKGDADVDSIFMDDEGYSINKDELSFSSKNVQADADDGIFKVNGLGIDINPDRFSHEGDTFDPSKGVYKTADGSIDIDLQNNKYIDSENGIFVDPKDKISAFIDKDGSVKHFAMMPFKGSSMSGTQTNYGADVIQPNPSPFKAGSLLGDFWSTIKQSPLFADFFQEHTVNQSTDIMGRQIVTVTDANGNKYPSTVPDTLPKVFENFGPGSKVVSDHAQAVNDAKFNTYIHNKYPTLQEYTASFKNSENTQPTDNDYSFEDTSIASLVQNVVHRTALQNYLDKGHTMDEALADDDGNGIPNFMEEHAFYKGSLADYLEKGHTLQDALSDDDGNDIPNFMENNPFYKGAINAFIGKGHSIEEAFADVNHNGIPDFLEENIYYKGALQSYLSQGHSAQEAFDDADENGIPDFLQSDPAHMKALNDFINRGYSIEDAFGDDDGDSVPNYLDDDMDGNGIPDDLEGK